MIKVIINNKFRNEVVFMSIDIMLTLGVLLITIILFVIEAFRVDVIAIIIMISLSWLGLVNPMEAFSGFSSNAVISIIAVMIMGYGIDRSGIMKKFTIPIINFAGKSEKRLIGTVSAAVGISSAFMQNIGATALFLPAVMRISKKINIPLSRLLMPIGFAAILGGTLTMVASGPLIILNDLLIQGGEKAFNLFSVTPLGLLLLFSGIMYFLLFGKKILPYVESRDNVQNNKKNLAETLALPTSMYSCQINADSTLCGETRESSKLWDKYHLNLLALTEKNEIVYAPWRFTRFAEGQSLILMGREENIIKFAHDYKLIYEKGLLNSKKYNLLKNSRFAEIIISPFSNIAGKTLREISLRKNYAINPVSLLRGGEETRGDFSDLELQSGDTLIVHGLIDNLKSLNENGDFVLVTSLEDKNNTNNKPIIAISSFLIALILVLSGIKLSLALFTGALLMILTGVVTPDEIYKAVDWRTVFLLSGLIPLGIAMEKTGAAAFLANKLMLMMQGSHVIFLLLAIAILSTVFTLFMSNVAATVVLVPLVMIMGKEIGINPRGLALLVAVTASNSFVLPTHQVNALLMSPGGYHNKDYLKAGGILTFIFIIIVVGFIYLYYI